MKSEITGEYEKLSLTPKERKSLFLYRLVREGFFKNYERSLSAAIPLGSLVQLYEDLESRYLLLGEIPEGENEDNYFEIMSIIKQITSA